MIVEQNVQWSAVWDSDKKDFLGIITLRDLLEIIVFFTDSLKEAISKEEATLMNEKSFLYYFLDCYMNVGSNNSGNRKSRVLKKVESGLALRPDLSLLPKILE